MEAVRKGNAICIDVLFESGVDVDLECFNLYDFISTAQEDQEQCADVLGHTGANANINLSVGEAALLYAVANCFLPCVISLLHAGTDVNINIRC